MTAIIKLKSGTRIKIPEICNYFTLIDLNGDSITINKSGLSIEDREELAEYMKIAWVVWALDHDFKEPQEKLL